MEKMDTLSAIEDMAELLSIAIKNYKKKQSEKCTEIPEKELYIFLDPDDRVQPGDEIYDGNNEWDDIICNISYAAGTFIGPIRRKVTIPEPGIEIEGWKILKAETPGEIIIQNPKTGASELFFESDLSKCIDKFWKE